MANRFSIRTTLTASFTVASLVALTTLPTAAHAQLKTFDLTYSGAALGNSATATGFITLDLSALGNLTRTDQNQSAFVTDFSLTITGASSGNGTFTFADFNGAAAPGGFIFDSNGVTLDFNKELIGQPTNNGPFGVDYSSGMVYSGDFNIFSNGSNTAAPIGSHPFTIRTNSGAGPGVGDELYVTSFRPSGATAAAAPEPGSIALLLTAGVPIVGIVRRRKKH